MTIERQSGGIYVGSLLDLDKGDDASAPGDEIHLAAANSRPPRKDPPAA